MPHFEGLHLRHNVRSLKNSTWRKYRAKLILVVQMFEWKLVGRFKYNSTKCSCCVLEQKSCVKNVVSWNSKTDFSCSSRNFTEAWNQKRNNNFPFQKPKLSSKSIYISLSRLRPLLKPNFEFERIFEEFQFSNLHRVAAMKMECVKKPFLLFSWAEKMMKEFPNGISVTLQFEVIKRRDMTINAQSWKMLRNHSPHPVVMNTSSRTRCHKQNLA